MIRIGILNIGGTILGSSRTPFKTIGEMEDGVDKVKEMKKTYRELKLDCLVVLGGNGSQKTANLLREEGLNIIALPKTIDNDLWGTKRKKFTILAVAEGAISQEDAKLSKKEYKKKLKRGRKKHFEGRIRCDDGMCGQRDCQNTIKRRGWKIKIRSEGCAGSG